MLSESDIEMLCSKLALSESTKAFIQNIRRSEPSRLVQGRRGNVTARYPSRKMMRTIQAESHKVELAAIYEMEYDDDVLEYYDQPPAIPLKCPDANGRNRGFMHTPDFLAVKKKCVGYYELKPEKELERLSKKNPNRYRKDENGKWICPPGIEFARQHGLFYEVWSDNAFDWILIQNIIFLEDYFRSKYTVSDDVKSRIHDAFSNRHYYSIKDLTNYDLSITVDDILSLIAGNELYCDLYRTPLAKTDEALIFNNRTIYECHVATEAEDFSEKLHSVDNRVIVEPGAKLIWDGVSYTILNAGETEITLQDNNGRIFTTNLATFSTLVKNGMIKGLNLDTSFCSKNLQLSLFSGDEKSLGDALDRLKKLKSFKAGVSPKDLGVSKRTLFRWASRYGQAESASGYGLYGLISGINNRGNDLPKLAEQTIILINKVIDENYETIINKTIAGAYRDLDNKCRALGVIPPSIKTFRKYIKQRPKHELVLSREGKRAAYKHEFLHWDLEYSTPRHGQRPFEICHIDHTELDIELLSSDGINLGRPWLTIMIDAYSRVILSHVLTFDPPSHRSCMMVLRECVRRHGRFPQSIVVDNGAEFNAVYFETLLALYQCTKKSRPPAMARFGSVCERFFKTNDQQFIHNLVGNTQLMKNVRQVTKSVNPKNHACWTLGELNTYLSRFLYEVYANNIHTTLGRSPLDAFNYGLLNFGHRPHILIPCDEHFIVSTLPSTSKGTATITLNGSIKVNGIQYFCEDFRNPELSNKSLPVRFDPFDCGIAYALVKGKWSKCYSQYFSAFQGRSIKELKIASQEILRRIQNGNAIYRKNSLREIAQFLLDAESNELLLKQRIKEQEFRFSQNIESGIKKESDLNGIHEQQVGNSGAEGQENENISTYEEFEDESE